MQKVYGGSSTAIATARRITELVTPEQLVDERTFVKWIPRFSANYGVQYAWVARSADGTPAAPTPDATKMRMLFEQLVRLGWSNQMFEERAGQFLVTCKYASWTIAEFFGSGDPQPVCLHPYGWLVQQINEHHSNAEAIACYIDDQGRKGWGWIHELEGRLERAPQERGWKVGALPEPEEPAPDVREQLELTKITLERDDLAAQVKRLTEQVSTLTTDRDEARATRDLHADTIVAYERLVTQLLDGELTVDELREEMTAEDPPEMTDEELLREAGQPEMFGRGAA